MGSSVCKPQSAETAESENGDDGDCRPNHDPDVSKWDFDRFLEFDKDLRGSEIFHHIHEYPWYKAALDEVKEALETRTNRAEELEEEDVLEPDNPLSPFTKVRDCWDDDPDFALDRDIAEDLDTISKVEMWTMEVEQAEWRTENIKELMERHAPRTDEREELRLLDADFMNHFFEDGNSSEREAKLEKKYRAALDDFRDARFAHFRWASTAWLLYCGVGQLKLGLDLWKKVKPGTSRGASRWQTNSSAEDDGQRCEWVTGARNYLLRAHENFLTAILFMNACEPDLGSHPTLNLAKLAKFRSRLDSLFYSVTEKDFHVSMRRAIEAVLENGVDAVVWQDAVMERVDKVYLKARNGLAEALRDFRKERFKRVKEEMQERGEDVTVSVSDIVEDADEAFGTEMDVTKQNIGHGTALPMVSVAFMTDIMEEYSVDTEELDIRNAADPVIKSYGAHYPGYSIPPDDVIFAFPPESPETDSDDDD